MFQTGALLSNPTDYAANFAIVGFNQTTGVVCGCGFCYGNASGLTKLDLSNCNNKKIASDTATVFSSKQDVQARVPCDTQHSELRGLYNRLRLMEHCIDSSQGEWAIYKDGLKSAPDILIRMIFQATIAKNLALYYSDDIKKIKEAFVASSCANSWPNLELSCADDSTSANEDNGNLTQLPYSDPNLKSCTLSMSQSDLIIKFQGHLVMTLGNWDMIAACIPQNWVEPAQSANELTPLPKECR